MHAKISGTTFDITTTLTRLIESPTVPRVPLTSGASRPGQLDTTQWNSVVPRTYWSTPRDYDRLLKDVQEKGWANLREEGSWWPATASRSAGGEARASSHRMAKASWCSRG